LKKFNFKLLKSKRTKMGLTTTQVGARIGLSAVSIFNHENGIHQPPFDVLLKYKQIYQIPLIDDFWVEEF